jgi:hypothetical protein
LGTDLQSKCRVSKVEIRFAIVINDDDERAESKAKYLSYVGRKVNRRRLKLNKKNIPELMVRYGCAILYLGIVCLVQTGVYKPLAAG